MAQWQRRLCSGGMAAGMAAGVISENVKRHGADISVARRKISAARRAWQTLGVATGYRIIKQQRVSLAWRRDNNLRRS